MEVVGVSDGPPILKLEGDASFTAIFHSIVGDVKEDMNRNGVPDGNVDRVKAMSRLSQICECIP